MRGQTSGPARVAGLFGFALLQRKTVLVAGIIMMMLSLGLIGAPSSWANSLTYQNVTFNLNVNGSGNLDLNIVNALNATGNWAGIDTLDAFAINNYGTASGLALTSWTYHDGGLSAGGGGGCNDSGSGFCFSNAGFALSNDFTLTITKTSGIFNLNLSDGEGGFGPHLKVFFSGASTGNGHGDLLSKTVPVPVPGTLLMFGLGFVMFVLWYHRHSRKQVALASAA